MKYFVLRVIHDKGVMFTKTCSTSESNAISVIAMAEGCPTEAIKAKEIPFKLWGMNAKTLFTTIN